MSRQRHDRFKISHNRDLTRSSTFEDYSFIDYSKRARQQAIEAGCFLDCRGDLVRCGQEPAATIDLAIHLSPCRVGCGVILHSANMDEDASGSSPLHGRNRILLRGLLTMLPLLVTPHCVRIRCSTGYLVDNMMQGYAHRWRLNGWKKADGTEVKSRALWERILALGDRHKLRFEPPIWPRSARMLRAEELALRHLLNLA